jgi:hypothetical protein
MNNLRLYGLVVFGSLFAATVQAAVTFHVDVDTHMESNGNAKNVPSDSHGTFDVTLADKFILVKSVKETTIFDFDKRKRIVINNEAKTRVDYSLYDTVGFRVFELRNREMLGKMLAAAKVGSNTMGSVGNEHILAVQDKPSTPLQAQVDSENESFSFESKALFMRSLKSTPVTPGDARMFAQYVRYVFGGHPQVLTALASGNAIPSKLTMSTYDVVSTTRKIDITSVLASNGKPLDLSTFQMRVATESADPLDQLLDRAAVAPDKEVVEARVHSKDELARLFREGQIFDAFLATIEWSLMTGDPIPALTSEQKEMVQADKSVQLLSSAMSPPKTKEGLAEAIKVLANLKGSASAKSHVLKIFEANYRAMLGDRVAARTLFIEALTTNPYIAGAYKDLGDVLIMSFDTPRAWRSWDLGRKIAPMFSNFGAVSQFENSLATSHPEYF